MVRTLVMLAVLSAWEVAVSAAGRQSVVVPWRALAPHLDSSGPAVRLAP